MQKALYGIGVLAVAIFCQCASKATPPGGPKDETPPKIVADKSTPNEQVRFSDRSFLVTLDEWVELEDVFNQVLVSPPLERRPDVRLKGRSVIFKFHEEEVLRDNATYTINFGEAIRDITEKNILKNFSFVFSTGDVLDSMSAEGMIVDAYTAEPVENATIMFYESLEDSIPLQEKPFYATKSDKSGFWQIRNMKEGTFKVVAILDNNLNYRYDPATEKIAFPDTFVTITGDSIPQIRLLLSEPTPALFVDRRDTSLWNQANFTFNRPPYELQVSYADPDGSLVYDVLNNNLTIWYFGEDRQEWPLYLETVSKIDTFLLRIDRPGPKMQKIQKLNRLINSGHPSTPFYLCLDRPVEQIETSQILLLEGRIARNPVPVSVEIQDSLPMCLAFKYPWVPDSSYQLLLLPGSLTDFFQLENDTIAENFPIGNVERFGNITLNVTGLSPDHSYLVELGVKDKPEIRFAVDSIPEFNRTITGLKPASYSLRIIEDRNRNGRWDPGHLLQKIQPERTRKEELETLRANWDVEVNFNWGDQ
jgi:hypothetical protein